MAKAPTKPDTEAGELKTEKVPVIVVTAPGGQRRRAGYSFGPSETTFTEAELGGEEKAKDLIDAWRADPMLKVDARFEERPAAPADAD